MTGPYATVIDVKKERLPDPAHRVAGWSVRTSTSARLRHDQANAAYNPDFRQLIHVGFKVAAEMGTRYLDALKQYEKIIAQNVTDNLFTRHIKPIFG